MEMVERAVPPLRIKLVGTEAVASPVSRPFWIWNCTFVT
jgi:hypothetical protein